MKGNSFTLKEAERNYLFNKRIEVITEKLKNLLILKNRNYGSSFEKSCDKYGDTVYLIRLEDKLNRLTNMVLNNIKDGQNNDKENESVDDTLLDIAGYALLAYEYRANKNDEYIKNHSNIDTIEETYTGYHAEIIKATENEIEDKSVVINRDEAKPVKVNKKLKRI